MSEIVLRQCEARIKYLAAENARLRLLMDDLVTACDAAYEWSAGYPLGAGTDEEAAIDVYNKCLDALAKAKETVGE